jgi:hypothetical protein
MRLLPNWTFGLLGGLVLWSQTTTARALALHGADTAGSKNNFASDDDYIFDFDTVQQPRAALVAYVREDKVYDMANTMQRVEAAFNGQHKYDWIIFSDNQLSDDLKAILSNATCANTFHELLVPGHQQPEMLPGKGDTRSRDCGDARAVGLEATGEAMDEKYSKNPSFPASAGRLFDYDWFWKVEPGVSRWLGHVLQSKAQSLGANLASLSSRRSPRMSTSMSSESSVPIM